MHKPTLFRRRYIPDEKVHLKDDEILTLNDDMIITKWTTLKPRKDFVRGYSCYFIKKGFKISKFIDKNHSCIYYYCDIIDTEYDKKTDTFVFNDLLIDIVVYKDNYVKVLDIGEIPLALDKNLISIETSKKALFLADTLLEIIYNGKFHTLTNYLNIEK